MNLKDLQADLAKAVGKTDTPAGHCYVCKDPFSDQNVHTAAGWAETRISGMCENCWDETFAESDEDE